MATTFADSVIQYFPVGTTVGAYPATSFLPHVSPSAAPTVSATTTAVVAADGTLALTGLTANTRYRIGYDTGGGVWKYMHIATNDPPSQQLLDNQNVALGSTTGSQIGTATTQKLGFHGSTPVVQRSGAAQVAVATTTATQTTPWGFSTQAQANAIVTLVNELQAALVAKGIIKGSA
jgi:hypothetical protein